MRLHGIKTYYDHQLGLVTLEDDVLSIVRQVRELYGDRIFIQVDDDSGWYHFVERCTDGTDRLVFSCDTLDPRALARLQRADSHSRAHVDSYDEAEQEQDRLQEEADAAYRETLHEAGERLVHALKKDDAEPRLPLTVPVTYANRHR